MEDNQNQIPSAQVPPVVLDEFEKCMQMLAELPTDKAMKELQKISSMRNIQAIEKVVETMALGKMDLIKSLRLMRIRELALLLNIDADRAIQQWIKDNPTFDIQVVAQ
jgi:hypothetical protein